MARLVSIASGNFTAAATWGVSNTTMFTDSQTGSHAIGTSATTFGSTVPGAITISGVAIKIAQRATSPSGTFTVYLRNVTTATDVTSVTINVSDLPTPGTAGQFGWHMFKFSANQTLTAGQAYTLKMQCSASGSQVTVYSGNVSAGAALPSAIWVTTTTAAPATGDAIHIMGDYTGTGTGNTYTVTMDNTVTTLDIGASATYITSDFTINNKGILACGTSASTAYALKISTNPRIYTGGIWRIGQRGGTALPSTSTCTITMDCIADNDFRIFVEEGGTFQCYWDFNGKLDRCYLNTDEAAAQTVLGVDSNTGWVNNDLIAIASTSRTFSQDERRTVSSSTASTVTISSGLTNAHSGTSPTQAEVVLLTRGIKFTVTTSSSQSGLEVATTSTVDIYGAEFRYFSQTSGTAAILIKTTTGSCTVERCSIYDGEVTGIINSGATSNNFSILDCVFHDLNTGAGGYPAISVAATSGTAWTVDGNWIIGDGATTGVGISLSDEGGTFTDNVITGMGGIGLSLSESNPSTNLTMSNNKVHSCASYGVYVGGSGKYSRSYSGITVWRCNTYGLYIAVESRDITYTDFTFWGNATASIGIGSTAPLIKHNFVNIVSNGDSSFSTTAGFNAATGRALVDFEFQNCDFSVASGILTAHTNDFLFADTGTPKIYATFYVNSSNLGASTEVSGVDVLHNGSFVRIQKKDKTVATHITYLKYGTLQLDSSVFNTAAPSLKMTPNSASFKLESAPLGLGVKAAVASGGTITASVYVRKNTGYTGAQPRLIVRKNYAAGITSDTVLDTMTAAVATWEQLTGTTAAVTDDAVLEFIVDCDGTAQYVNIDDWTVS